MHSEQQLIDCVFPDLIIILLLGCLQNQLFCRIEKLFSILLCLRKKEGKIKERKNNHKPQITQHLCLLKMENMYQEITLTSTVHLLLLQLSRLQERKKTGWNFYLCNYFLPIHGNTGKFPNTYVKASQEMSVYSEFTRPASSPTKSTVSTDLYPKQFM